ncbi:hypothetical protein GJ496_004097 [Pomphorhynchus laevis]|nr:hypothetical protein GJ496_004097 [Pomphorhynchus laevis]
MSAAFLQSGLNLNRWDVLVNTRIKCKSTIPFITIPMFYLNSKPHIGHLYSAVLADSLYRWKCLRNHISFDKGIFAVGTDEHGQKVFKSCSNNVPILEHCDQVSSKFRHLFHQANISYTYFSRTTSDKHVDLVGEMWKKLTDKGFIVKGEFEGWYSEDDECFYSPREVLKSSDSNIVTSKSSGSIVYWTKEENYFLQIESLKSKIKDWLHAQSITDRYVPVIQKYIDTVPPTISVSRPRKRCHWGIDVPSDSSQVIYVWFDALACYLEAAGWPDKMVKWPPDVQIVGKDIIRFHSVLWTAILLALGLELPKYIRCHGHLLNNNLKISKRLGNSSKTPDQLISEFSCDGLRYALIRVGALEEDVNFDDITLKRIVNSELANNLGNLLRRATSKLVNPDQLINLESDYISWHDDVITLMDQGNLYGGLIKIYEAIRSANLKFHEHAPWKKRDDKVVSDVLNDVRKAAILMQHITPSLSLSILEKLGLQNKSQIHHLTQSTESSVKLSQSSNDILFPRIEIKL